MTDSVLFPPNNHQLTDTIICAVVQRVQRQFDIPSDEKDDCSTNINCIVPSASIPHSIEVDCDPKEMVPCQKPGSIKSSGNTLTSRKGQSSANWDVEHHRQRRRMYQERYRKKICGRTTQFKKDVRLLHEQIRQLERRRLNVLSGLPTKVTPWQVVAEYCSLFRYGFKPSMDTQKKFLERTFAPDVITQSGVGVESLLADWEILRLCYEDLELKLVRMENVKEDIILAFMIGYTTITKKTLLNGFPHLIH